MGGFCDTPTLILIPFENYVKEHAPQNYVKYVPYHISQKGGSNYLYVYNAKACKRLSQYVNANTFIMARVRLVRYKRDNSNNPIDCYYDIEVKVFSLITEKEHVIFSYSDIPLGSLPTLLSGKEHQLWQAIIDVSKEESA